MIDGIEELTKDVPTYKHDYLAGVIFLSFLNLSQNIKLKNFMHTYTHRLTVVCVGWLLNLLTLQMSWNYFTNKHSDKLMGTLKTL